jgi:uncharacterized protein YrrD
MERGSYMLITPGMPVVGVDGTIGNVAEVVADSDMDVFRGIVVSHGVLSPKRAFLASDDITAVTDKEVDVRLSKADFDRLPVPETVQRGA